MVLSQFATLYICSIHCLESGGIHSVLSDIQPRNKRRCGTGDGRLCEGIGGDAITIMIMIVFD